MAYNCRPQTCWQQATAAASPANTRTWPNVVSILAHRLRRWSNIETTLGQVIVTAAARWAMNACHEPLAHCRVSVCGVGLTFHSRRSDGDLSVEEFRQSAVGVRSVTMVRELGVDHVYIGTDGLTDCARLTTIYYPGLNTLTTLKYFCIVFFQFEININVLVSAFCFIWIPLVF